MDLNVFLSLNNATNKHENGGKIARARLRCNSWNESELMIAPVYRRVQHYVFIKENFTDKQN